jgi:hypothetical protein
MTTPPPDYVPPYSDVEILLRIKYLAKRCGVFAKGYLQRYPDPPISFDPLVIVNITKSAMDDIRRYKAYHQVELSDAVKRAAYFTKWILWFRPIYVGRPTGSHDFTASFDPKDKSLLINELFALNFSLATLATDAKVPCILLTARTQANLLYDFHYRDVNDDYLLAFYDMIITLARGEKVIS